MAQSPAPAQTTTTEDRSTAFRPVEGGNDMQSGEALLVEAYAAIWALVLIFVWLSWRRQKHVDTRITDLEAALAKVRAEVDGKH